MVGLSAGANVVLADKGYCGKSGATAAAGVGVWGVGGRALRPDRPSKTIDTEAVVLGVQKEVMPYEKNLFRSDRRLKESSSVLDGLWQELDGHAPAGTQALVRAREAAAMVATARWMYASARKRTETRGMHKHEDFASLDVAQQRCC